MHENEMVITAVQRFGKNISYSFEVSGPWQICFKNGVPYTIEYPVDVSGVPESIAVIPLLCNILPIAWLFDAHIILPECDEDFFYSIPQFKNGYIEMYPSLNFLGEIVPSKLIKNKATGTRSAAFFSGGVDATYTLISHFDEKPILLTLWGADIEYEDEEGWACVSEQIKGTALAYELECDFIKTPFRRILRDSVLTKVVKNTGEEWWHGFQHGIGIISHAAPLSYIHGFINLYIASSFNIHDSHDNTCASYPSIDNNVKFCGCSVFHDGFEFSRQDKIHTICQYADSCKSAIPLHVCWESKGGSNCCHCEKCARTMLAIVAENHNPSDFGFIWNEQVKKDVKDLLLNKEIVLERRYEYIRKKLKRTIQENPDLSEWSWLCDFSYEELNNRILKRIRNMKVYKFPRRVINKIERELKRLLD